MLDRHPRAARMAVLALMAVALAGVALPALDIAAGIARSRQSASTASATALAADAVALDLERGLSGERLARLAPNEAGRAAACAGLEGVANHAAGVLAALQTSPALEPAVARLRDALPPAFASLRAACAEPAVAARDEAALAPARRLAGALNRAATRSRFDAIGRIGRRERAGLAGALVVVSSAMLLLGGSLLRLISSRERVKAAWQAEAVQWRRLEAAVEGMREGVALFDGAGRLMLGNAKFAHTLGTEPAKLAAGAPFETVAVALAASHPPAITAPLEAGAEPASGEIRLGSSVLEYYRSTIPAGGELLTLADVTRRIESEEIARQAQKLDALGRLTGGVAHDFNNLLQALSSNLEAIEASAPDPDMRRTLAPVFDLVDRGTRLTRDLLSYARVRREAAAAIATDAVLRRMQELLARTLGDRIELQVVLEAGLWPVVADRGALENAILNLAINARDAMPDGGKLSIVATNARASDDATEWVRICVADTGEGMTSEQLRRAIEPFYTTKPEGIGTGLGLAMVRRFAAEARGTLTLESEPGHGTRATLVLPRAETGPADQALPYEAEPVRGEGETILLVEDDRAVRHAVCSGLRAIGYGVVEAEDAGAACRRLDDDGLRPDLVLSDVMMPGTVDAAGLVRCARRLSPFLPILFNTGDPEARALAGITFDAHIELLGKPWRLEALARRIRAMLDAAAVARAAAASEPMADLS